MEELQGKSILFVDDRPDSVVAFRKELEDLGAKTKTRRSINSALRELGKEDFDLVVIDLFLPNDYGGLETYRDKITMNGNNQGELLACYLRQANPRVPYVYLTSQRGFYAGDEDGLVFIKTVAQIDLFIKKSLKLMKIS